jgi:hypothetical protein
MSEAKAPQTPEPAHDVLAAEAFAMPGADPSLRTHPVVLPGDPTGIAEPHDVLSAEDFAIPAPPLRVGSVLTKPGGPWGIAIGGAAVALAVRTARRVLRRR